MNLFFDVLLVLKSMNYYLECFYSNSSLGFFVCFIMYPITNLVISLWCGTQVVRTLPVLVVFLNVVCLADLVSLKPLLTSISITLRWGNGRSFAMQNTIRDFYRNVCQGY